MPLAVDCHCKIIAFGSKLKIWIKMKPKRIRKTVIVKIAKTAAIITTITTTAGAAAGEHSTDLDL